MNISRLDLLDRLRPEKPCLGALFCSFTFDPAFFERQVLRTVLEIDADPEDDAQRFIAEATQKLRDVPVACFVDGQHAGAGQQLPYDLLRVPTRVFHPKVVLLLLPGCVRLAIGSGNLTRSGYSGNAELFWCDDLVDGAPNSGPLLTQVLALLQNLRDRLSLSHEARIDELLAAIGRRLVQPLSAAPRPVMLLHSIDGPILDRFLALVPTDAKIERVGVLAPFHETDDADAAEDDALGSVLARLAGTQMPDLDVGVPWRDGVLAPAVDPAPRIEDALGQLWRWRSGTAEGQRLEVVVPLRVNGDAVVLADHHGSETTASLRQLAREIADGRLALLPPPVVVGPGRIVAAVGRRRSRLTVWLHPEGTFADGQPQRRPLHAKLVAVQARVGRRRTTWLLVGSPNASKRALLQAESEGGNVETAVAMVVDGALSIVDLAPDLVTCGADILQWSQPSFAPVRSDMARWVDAAVWDASDARLTVTWADTGPGVLGAWTLSYRETPVARGSGAPGEPSIVEAFPFRPGCCELTLETAGESFAVPLLVANAAALPDAYAPPGPPTLSELLALLGGRVGAERLGVVRTERGGAGVDAVLTALFGDGFGSQDVFNAWWRLARDLAAPHLTVAGVRARLRGRVGAQEAWRALQRAAADGQVRHEEVWFFGSELRDALHAIVWPADLDAVARRVEVQAFCEELRTDLDKCRPADLDLAWLTPLLAHYEVTP